MIFLFNLEFFLVSIKYLWVNLFVDDVVNELNLMMNRSSETGFYFKVEQFFVIHYLPWDVTPNYYRPFFSVNRRVNNKK